MRKPKLVLWIVILMSLAGTLASVAISKKRAAHIEKTRNLMYKTRFGICTVTTYTNWTTMQQAPWQSYWHTNEFYTYPVIGPCPYTYLYEVE